MEEQENVSEIQAKIDAELNEFLGIKEEPKAAEVIPLGNPNEQLVQEVNKEAEATQEQPKVIEAENTETEWWENPTGEEAAETQTEDWKAKHDDMAAKFSKVENDKFLKTLYDLKDSPNFDLEKFLETQITKRVDYSQLPLENLYKASLEADKIAGYTDAEIEEMWQDKKSEIEGKSAQEKALKSKLIKELQDSDPAMTGEEPELIKSWRQDKVEKEEAQAKVQSEFKEVNEGITTFTKSLVGKEIGGVKITEEHEKQIIDRMNLDYYRRNGKLDANLIAMDRAKAVLFDEMYKHMKTSAVIEAKKQVTRPTNQSSGGGQVGDTDGRDEAQRIVDDAMAALGK